MLKHKKLVPFLSVLFSVLLVGQNCQVAFAKKSVATLKLKTAEINASVVDTSRNILVIEDATGIDPTVVVKPGKKTLKNGKPIKILGTRGEDGSLSVDLTALGPANLIPSGEYILTAKKNGRAVKSKFIFRAPKLVVGKLQIPVPASEATKARIIRYQTEGVLPEDENLPEATFGVYNEDQEVIDGSLSYAVPAEQTVINDQLLNVYPYVIEIPPDTDLSYAVVKTEVEAPTATGTETVVLNAIAFNEDANTSNNIISNVDVDAASNAATNIVTATLTEVKEVTDGEDISLGKTYSAAVEAIAPVLESVDTVDGQITATEAACQTNSTDIYKGIAEDLSNAEGIPPAVVAETATDLALIAPEIAKEAPENLLNHEELKENFEANTFAGGYLNLDALKEAGIPIPEDSQIADILNDANVVLGGFEQPTEEDIQKALEEGTIPAPKISSKAIETLALLKEKFEQGGFGAKNFNPALFKSLPVPATATLDLDTINLESFGDFSIEALPGSFLQGENSGNLEIVAHKGVFAPEGIANKFTQFSGEAGNIQYPPAFSPPVFEGDEFVPAFMHPEFTSQFAQGNFKIFGGDSGSVDIKGNVLELPSQNSLPSTSGIEVFNASTQGNVVSQAANVLGNNFGNFFGSVAVQLTTAFTNSSNTQGAGTPTQTPTSLFTLAGEGVKFGNFAAPVNGQQPVSTGGFDISSFDGSKTTTTTMGGNPPPPSGSFGFTPPPVDGQAGSIQPLPTTTKPVDGQTPPSGGFVPPADGSFAPPTNGQTPPADGSFAPPTNGQTPPPTTTGTPPIDGQTPPPGSTPPPGGSTPPPGDSTPPPTTSTYTPTPTQSAPPPSAPPPSAPPPSYTPPPG